MAEVTSASGNPAVTADRAPVPFLRVRLSFMMFLQYAIWGAWLPLLYQYLTGHLKFAGDEVGMIFVVGAAGSIVAPFVAGQIADRWFPTQWFLGISHIAGGVLVWQLAGLRTYSEFMWFSLAYSLIYSPTLSLTNSLAFHHLPDRDRQFGGVRMWGTVGWICVGILIGQWLLHRHTPETGDAAAKLLAQQAGMADAFRLSAILGVVMGVYCIFGLPHTPPSKGRQANATFEAIGQLRYQPLLTLFLMAVPISCIHQFYFVHTAGFLGRLQSTTATEINKLFGVGGGGLMTIGQMSEIIVLALMPLVTPWASRKLLLLVGTLAYAARMALFAYVLEISRATGVDPQTLLIAGVAMHGLCFGCWIFVAIMVVDEECPPDVRASAQSLLGLVVFGIGIMAGSMIATSVVPEWSKNPDGTTDYTALFSHPMYASLIVFALLLIFYPMRSPRRGSLSDAAT
ncbi:MAG: MFS transporter [Phycisphaeraceae bacterium]|nr:MFS transporter [Phycisphaeraceae bacterium]